MNKELLIKTVKSFIKNGGINKKDLKDTHLKIAITALQNEINNGNITEEELKKEFESSQNV